MASDREVAEELARNHNPRDPGLMTKRSLDLHDALSAMWDAGASLQEIAAEIAGALAYVTVAVDVTITPQ